MKPCSAFFLPSLRAGLPRLPRLLRRGREECFSTVVFVLHFLRKDDHLSPAETGSSALHTPHSEGGGTGKAFFPAPLPGSLTAEAAIALPVFLLCMLTVLGYANVYRSAARQASAMTQASEEMAIAAYASGGAEGNPLAGAAVSLAYASGRTRSLAGSQPSVQSANFLLSRFLEENDTIDLVMTWQARGLSSMVPVPGTFFIQRAAVRGWTGRQGSGASGVSEDGSHSHQTVYVAENGVVYHTDPNCTHIHLKISMTTAEQAMSARNRYREKYHACERCGSHTAGIVYITTDGNRYHTSLECSGLKRTVSEMELSDASETLRPCSKCAGRH